MMSKKMKEFDLAKAKAGAPVCTRDGKPARIICWDRKDAHYPILYLAERRGVEGVEEVSSTTVIGHIFADGRCANGDLFMAPVKHEGWVHVYDEFCVPFTPYGKIYKTKEQANAAPKTERFITVAKIEWEE